MPSLTIFRKRLLMTSLLSATLLFSAGQQPLPNFYPKEKFTLDLSVKRQKDIEKRDQLLAKKTRTKQEQKELDGLLVKNDETIENVWSVIPMECSWYCGDGNYKVKASSSLSGGTGHSAQSANDLSYQTAWVEGKEDEGTGEYLEYFFKNKSPRVTQIIISNGYVKSEAVWKNNNRVKVLKLFINGKPKGLLHLEDTRDDQVFEVGTLGRNKDGSELVLRFEIAEVYKGDKYNDTAVTEIYFDGIDVH